MELAETSIAHSDRAGGHSPTGEEPSVSSSLRHLAAGTQGVITKRIDLALLEGQDLLSRSIERAALVGAGMVLAAAAWFAGAGAFVLFVVPDANPVIRNGIEIGWLPSDCGNTLARFRVRHTR